MPPRHTHTSETPNGSGDGIKVGTTGTVSSLMSKELESIKQSAQAQAKAKASSSNGKKIQDPPVSVPCGYSPKRAQPRRNPVNDPHSREETQNIKPKPRRNECKAPMLAGPTLETHKEKSDKKKGHTYIAEVVDLKCNNPMSSRLKKLSFSKLSESSIV